MPIPGSQGNFGKVSFYLIEFFLRPVFQIDERILSFAYRADELIQLDLKRLTSTVLPALNPVNENESPAFF